MPELVNTVPYEIIGAPLTVWVAPVGTAFPEVDEAPGVAWTKVGTSGDLNYNDEGVTVEHSQALNFFRSAGEAGSRKVFRTEEDMKVRVVLADVTLEQYRHALNNNSITTTPAGPGVAGTKKIGLSRGLNVATMAVLARGLSPYMAEGAAQYEVPIASQTGAQTVPFKKGDAALLALEWTTLVDPNAATPDERFGRLVAQTDAAES